MCGSPMLLSPEEIDLLLNLNKIALYKFTDPCYFSEEYVNKMKLHQEMSYQQQVEVFKAERVKEIKENSDKIVEGKLKKLKQSKKPKTKDQDRGQDMEDNKNQDTNQDIREVDEQNEEIMVVQDPVINRDLILNAQIARIKELPRNQA